MRLLLWHLHWARARVPALSGLSPEPLDGGEGVGGWGGGECEPSPEEDKEGRVRGPRGVCCSSWGRGDHSSQRRLEPWEGQRVSGRIPVVTRRRGGGERRPEHFLPSGPTARRQLQKKPRSRATLARRPPSKPARPTAFQPVPRTEAISSKLCSKFPEGTLMCWLENTKWFNCCGKKCSIFLKS